MKNTNINWLTFLNEQGAVSQNGHIEHFQNTPKPVLNLEREVVISPLTERGLLSVSGPDAYKFLQGQVTCDVEDLRHQQMRNGAHCTHKGRMIGSFKAFNLAEQSIALSINKGCLEQVKASLSKYIVFSKASLSIEEEFVGLGIAGKQAAGLLSTIFPDLNTEPYTTSNLNGNVALCIAPDHYECWLNLETAKQFWLSVSTRCQTVGEAHWNLLCIRLGLSEVRAETVEMFIPQMLNFDQLSGINYKKGCYTGQEVVARMTYLGKLKRHTYRAKLTSSSPPPPGTDLYTGESSQSIGNVVMAATTPAGDVECLICVTDQSVAADAVYLDQTQQQKLKTLTLPYAINSPEDDQ